MGDFFLSLSLCWSLLKKKTRKFLLFFFHFWLFFFFAVHFILSTAWHVSLHLIPPTNTFNIQHNFYTLLFYFGKANTSHDGFFLLFTTSYSLFPFFFLGAKFFPSNSRLFEEDSLFFVVDDHQLFISVAVWSRWSFFIVDWLMASRIKHFSLSYSFNLTRVSCLMSHSSKKVHSIRNKLLVQVHFLQHFY
jgi:hypothetical protein